MCIVLSNTLVTSQLATGKIRKYQIVITICGAWVFPLTWLAFKMGGSPLWAYFIFCAIYFLMVFVRIYLVKDLIKMPWTKYVKEVILKSGIVFVIAIIFPIVIYLSLPDSIIRFILVCAVSLITSLVTIYFVGMQTSERSAIMRLVKQRILER